MLSLLSKPMDVRGPICLAIFSWLCLGSPEIGFAQTSSAYQQNLLAHRASQDSSFKVGEHSPLAPEDKQTFTGLAYFPIDEAYRVQATFKRTAHETVFQMPTTGSRTPEYVKYGELHFVLQGQPLRLNVYQNQELIKQPKYLTYLFIPFTDATTGQETYATGRYLDFSIPMGTDSVWLDFNRAYNPYCAYSAGYSCPIPPKENKLAVRIEAGEKTYEKKQLITSAAPIMQESMPEFPGGLRPLFMFLDSKFEKPERAKRAEITGTVKFSFVVKADGTLDNFKIVESLRKDVDEAVLQAARQMPLWKPAMRNGKPVNFLFTIPFRVK